MNTTIETSDSKAGTGFVYVLEAGPYYKIGVTSNPARRIPELRIQLPFPVKVVLLIKHPDYRHLEKQLHQYYSPKRLNGEWFALTRDNLGFISDIDATTDIRNLKEDWEQVDRLVEEYNAYLEAGRK